MMLVFLAACWAPEQEPSASIEGDTVVIDRERLEADTSDLGRWRQSQQMVSALLADEPTVHVDADAKATVAAVALVGHGLGSGRAFHLTDGDEVRRVSVHGVRARAPAEPTCWQMLVDADSGSVRVQPSVADGVAVLGAPEIRLKSEAGCAFDPTSAAELYRELPSACTNIGITANGNWRDVVPWFESIPTGQLLVPDLDRLRPEALGAPPCASARLISELPPLAGPRPQ